MAFSSAPLSFEDCREALDRALEAPRGLKITLDTASAAVNLRARMNKYRSDDRKASKALYPPEDPRWGRSVYDRLVIQKDGVVLTIVKSSIENLKVEEL